MKFISILLLICCYFHFGEVSSTDLLTGGPKIELKLGKCGNGNSDGSENCLVELPNVVDMEEAANSLNPQYMDNFLQSRKKRYPDHLNPNLQFFPYWIRIGECPLSSDGVRQHFCPTTNTEGKWVCIDDYQLCDGTKHCPNAEDESTFYCLFYRALKSEVELLTRSISILSGSTAAPSMDQVLQTNRKHKNPSNSLDYSSGQ